MRTDGRSLGRLFPGERIELVTDEDGRFEAEVDPATYMLIATKDMLTSARHLGYGEHRRVREGEIKELVLTVRPGGGVQGTVVSEETGEPLPGAIIVTNPGSRTVCDDRGSFSIQGLGPAPQEIAAWSPGMRWVTAMLPVESGKMTEQNFELAPGYTMRGTVTDEEGAAVDAALVSVNTPHERSRYSPNIWYLRSTMTNAAGRFEIPGLSPDSQIKGVTVRHPDFAQKTIEGLVPPADGADELQVDVALDLGYMIMGKIEGPDGGPVAGASVSFRGRMGRSGVRTNASGEFVLDKIATEIPGYVQVRHETMAPMAVLATPGKDETLTWLDITMEPGHTAKGTVIDQNGDPVAGARLTPYARFTDDGPRAFISQAGGTDSEGVFLLGSLPADGVTVTVTINGYESLEDYPLNVDGVNTIIMQKR